MRTDLKGILLTGLLSLLALASCRPAAPADGLTAARALELAQAALEEGNSLLPCDSLLNIALEHYRRKVPERAAALFYKACVENEIEYDADAVAHLREGLAILDRHPGERTMRLQLLDLLGDLLYRSGQYGECLQTYRERLAWCDTAAARAAAYSDLANCFAVTGLADSVARYHGLAMEQGRLTGDSLWLAEHCYRLGLTYDGVSGEKAEAMAYVREALRHVPSGASAGRYHYALGRLLYDSGSIRDSIVEHLATAAADTLFDGGRVDILLGHVERDRGNYRTANAHYNPYMDYIDRRYIAERSVNTQQLVYDYTTKLHVQQAEYASHERRNRMVLLGEAACTLLALAILGLLHRHQRRRMELRHQMNMLKHTLVSLQKGLDGKQQGAELLKAQLQQPCTEAERRLLTQRIAAREEQIHSMEEQRRRLVHDNGELIDRLKEEVQGRSGENDLFLASVEATGRYMEQMLRQDVQQSVRQFRESALYREGIRLSEVSTIRADLPVFDRPLREALRKEVLSTFASYAAELRRRHPRLRDNDLVLLCLEASGMDSKAMAVCLGHPRANAVYKMRQRIQEKMEE